VAGVQTEHGHRSRGGDAQPFEDFDEGRLAGAIWSEQADNLSATVDREVDASKCVDRAVGLAESTNVDRNHRERMFAAPR
jgi:hypothetical protein